MTTALTASPAGHIVHSGHYLSRDARSLYRGPGRSMTWPSSRAAASGSTGTGLPRHSRSKPGVPGAYLIGRTETITLQPYSDDQVTDDAELVRSATTAS